MNEFCIKVCRGLVQVGRKETLLIVVSGWLVEFNVIGFNFRPFNYIFITFWFCLNTEQESPPCNFQLPTNFCVLIVLPGYKCPDVEFLPSSGSQASFKETLPSFFFFFWERVFAQNFNWCIDFEQRKLDATYIPIVLGVSFTFTLNLISLKIV